MNDLNYTITELRAGKAELAEKTQKLCEEFNAKYAGFNVDLLSIYYGDNGIIKNIKVCLKEVEKWMILRQ